MKKKVNFFARELHFPIKYDFLYFIGKLSNNICYLANMDKKRLIRNLLIVGGAYYLPWLIAWQFIRLNDFMTAGNTYRGIFGIFLLYFQNLFPLSLASFISGFVLGYTIESPKPFLWAFFLFLLTLFVGYSNLTYNTDSGLYAFLAEFGNGFIPGVFALVGFYLIWIKQKK